MLRIWRSNHSNQYTIHGLYPEFMDTMDSALDLILMTTTVVCASLHFKVSIPFFCILHCHFRGFLEKTLEAVNCMHPSHVLPFFCVVQIGCPHDLVMKYSLAYSSAQMAK